MEVNTKSIQEEYSARICVDSLIIWCNSKCNARVYNLAPLGDVLEYLYQFYDLALRSPRTTAINKLLYATLFRVKSNLSKDFLKILADWLGVIKHS